MFKHFLKAITPSCKTSRFFFYPSSIGKTLLYVEMLRVHWVALQGLLDNPHISWFQYRCPQFRKCNDITYTPSSEETWAKMPEILYSTLLGDSAWENRGVFGYSTWRPRNGVPLGVPRGPKGYPISRRPDRISKNPLTIPCRIPFWPSSFFWRGGGDEKSLLHFLDLGHLYM